MTTRCPTLTAIREIFRQADGMERRSNGARAPLNAEASRILGRNARMTAAYRTWSLHARAEDKAILAKRQIRRAERAVVGQGEGQCAHASRFLRNARALLADGRRLERAARKAAKK